MIGLRISRGGHGLKAYAKQLDDFAQTSPREAATAIRNDWAANVPIDTGAYQASIYVATKEVNGYPMAVARAHERRPRAGLAGPPTGDLSGDKAVVGTAVDYAVYNEYGTRYMAARPAFEPAVAKARREYGPAAAKKLRWRE